ncbi:MAG: DivIVA domain-containing protein, partial [Acidimicrobiales bacterium]
MELTSQLLRQVEFGSELRGYKTSEVDDFLETAAVGLDELREELSALR